MLPTDGQSPFIITVTSYGKAKYNNEPLELPIKDIVTKQYLFPDIGSTWYAVSDAVNMYVIREQLEDTAKTLTVAANEYDLNFSVDAKGCLTNFDAVQNNNSSSEYAQMEIKIYDLRGYLSTHYVDRYIENGTCIYFAPAAPYYETISVPEKPKFEDVGVGEYYVSKISNNYTYDRNGNLRYAVLTIWMWCRRPAYYSWVADRLYLSRADFANETPFDPDYRKKWCGRLPCISVGLAWFDIYDPALYHQSAPFHSNTAYIDVVGLGNSQCP